MKILKKSVSLVGAMLSALYLANIGAGLVELIPDNILFAGNLDELITALILICSLLYLGVGPEKPVSHVGQYTSPALRL